eukprot:TRINITY_DN3952_c1_g1_i1.p1 TRINITY_DN3952_c1_g1~~TRINITY_DN3952_c1_g1_i1.p1  ORF type:complete len:367 (+),score=82.66 TRINITY_DN3952_c1_g1_i1:109-1101(+)
MSDCVMQFACVPDVVLRLPLEGFAHAWKGTIELPRSIASPPLIGTQRGNTDGSDNLETQEGSSSTPPLTQPPPQNDSTTPLPTNTTPDLPSSDQGDENDESFVILHPSWLQEAVQLLFSEGTSNNVASRTGIITAHMLKQTYAGKHRYQMYVRRLIAMFEKHHILLPLKKRATKFTAVADDTTAPESVEQCWFAPWMNRRSDLVRYTVRASVDWDLGYDEDEASKSLPMVFRPRRFLATLIVILLNRGWSIAEYFFDDLAYLQREFEQDHRGAHISGGERICLEITPMNAYLISLGRDWKLEITVRGFKAKSLAEKLLQIAERMYTRQIS